MMPVYVGYDHREAKAIHTCVNSLVTRSSKPVSVCYLAKNQFEFHDPRHKDGYKPSNQFIFSRFLVPELQNYKGWALFVDGDMIVLEDISQLFYLRDESKAVMVVKHNYKTKFPVKYLGARNEDYPRKNWSSVVLWNCGHPANKVLTTEYIQNATGEHLHRFQWLTDDQIGELPVEWNWLVDEYPHNENAKLLHYTIGGPYFPDFANCDHAVNWAIEHEKADYAGV